MYDYQYIIIIMYYIKSTVSYTLEYKKKSKISQILIAIIIRKKILIFIGRLCTFILKFS